MSGLPQWFTSITLGDLVTTLLAFGAMLGALWAMTRPLRRTSKGFEQFLEDWNGVPERPGFDAIPGVPERLRVLERNARRDRELLERIDHELHPNSGGSMRDQLDRARRDMDATAREVQKLGGLVRDVESMRRAMENPRTLTALARRLDTYPDAPDVPEQREGG